MASAFVYCHDLNILGRKLDDSALEKRAWVVQEVTLAPRILHFAQDQMFWECSERRACESFPDKIPNNTSRKHSLHPSALSEPFLLGPVPPHLEWLSTWNNQVKKYSNKEISFPRKDKLIAISGLAKKIGPPENYLAGLWKRHLPDQLLWVVQDDELRPKPTRRTSEYRAPSWSWASMDGQVWMPEARWMDETDNAMKLVDVDIKLVADDPTGQVTSALLRVCGILACLRMKIGFEELDDQPHFDRNKGLQFVKVDPGKRKRRIKRYYLGTLAVPEERNPTTIFDRVASSLLSNFSSKSSPDLLACSSVFMDDWEAQDGEVMYCFVVKNGKSQSGLFLKPNGNRGQYTRCGKFNTSDWPQKEAPDNFRTLCKLSSTFVDSHTELYEEKVGINNEGHTQYIITIV